MNMTLTTNSGIVRRVASERPTVVFDDIKDPLTGYYIVGDMHFIPMKVIFLDNATPLPPVDFYSGFTLDEGNGITWKLGGINKYVPPGDPEMNSNEVFIKFSKMEWQNANLIH